MAIKYNGNSVTSVNYNNNTVNKIIYNGTIVWCRPYQLKLSAGTGVESYSVTRIASEEPTASTSASVSNNGTIYHGDTLRVSARAASGYSLDKTYPYDITVTGTTTVSVTASVETFTLEYPEITTFWTQDDRGSYVLSVYVKNPNLHIVTLKYWVVDNYGTTTLISTTTYGTVKSLEEVQILINYLFDDSVTGGTVFVQFTATNATNSPTSAADFGEVIETTTT